MKRRKFTAEQKADRLKRLRDGEILEEVCGYEEFVALCTGATRALAKRRKDDGLCIETVRRATGAPINTEESAKCAAGQEFVSGLGEPIGLYLVYNQNSDIVCGVAARSPRENQKFRVAVGVYHASLRPVIIGRDFLSQLLEISDTSIYEFLWRMNRNVYQIPDTVRFRCVLRALAENLTKRITPEQTT